MVFGNFDDDRQLTGASDGTNIGNVGDSLKVFASLGTIIPNTTVPYIKPLLNGSAQNMNVNGSVTPVHFDYVIPSGKTLYLTSMRILLADAGTTEMDDFGTLSGLTNGVDIKLTINGTEYTLLNVKTNMELSVNIEFNTIDTTAGWLSNSDVFSGIIRFSNPIKMTNSTSDRVRVTINDNISALDHLMMSTSFYEVI